MNGSWMGRRGMRWLVAIAAALMMLSSPAGALADEQQPAPLTADEFCQAWEQARDGAVSLPVDGMVVSGTPVATGTSCEDPDAGITLSDAAITSSDGGEAVTDQLAARSGEVVTGEPAPAARGAAVAAAPAPANASGDEIKNGTEVFKGARVADLRVELKADHIVIAGQLVIDWSGGTKTVFLFKGRLYAIDRWSVALSSPAAGTQLPNVGGTPISFNGTLAQRGADMTMSADADVPSLTLGGGENQVSVTGGHLHLSLGGGEVPLLLDVSGRIGLGRNVTIDGALRADFDAQGMRTLDGRGALAVAIPADASGTDGEIAGEATVFYARDDKRLGATFSGRAKLGKALLSEVAGTLDTRHAEFKAALAYDDAVKGISAGGGVAGVVYYGDDLAGATIKNERGDDVAAAKGDWRVAASAGAASSGTVAVKGELALGSHAGAFWLAGDGSIEARSGATEISGKGAFRLAGSALEFSFDGSVTSGETTITGSGSADGRVLALDGRITSQRAEGGAKATVYYGRTLTGLTVRNRAGATVAASPGDFVVSGDGRVRLEQLDAAGVFTVTKTGSDQWMTTTAQIRVGETYLAFKGIVAPGLVDLSGSGRVVMDGMAADFTGRTRIASGRVVIDGTAKVSTYYGIVTVSGALEKPDMNSSRWLMKGRAGFTFGLLGRVDAAVTWDSGQPLRFQFNINYCVLWLVCPRAGYTMQFRPDGGVAAIHIATPLMWWGKFTSLTYLATGFRVPITTSVDGII